MPTKIKPTGSRTVSASEFKATCLALMDEVEREGTEITITKHRKPVARIVPASKPFPFIGRTSGFMSVASDADLIAPLDPDWEPDADL
jgi:prevent-host-death family protein